MQNDVFSHGQAYVAISRVRARTDIRVLAPANRNLDGVVHIRNIVYHELLEVPPSSIALSTTLYLKGIAGQVDAAGPATAGPDAADPLAAAEDPEPMDQNCALADDA